MEFDILGLVDYLFECGADSVVHDSDVDFVVVVSEALHDGLVSSNVGQVTFALE